MEGGERGISSTGYVRECENEGGRRRPRDWPRGRRWGRRNPDGIN